MGYRGVDREPSAIVNCPETPRATGGGVLAAVTSHASFGGVKRSCTECLGVHAPAQILFRMSARPPPPPKEL